MTACADAGADEQLSRAAPAWESKLRYVFGMTARGVHFAIDDETAGLLLNAAGDDDEVMEIVERMEDEGRFDECHTGEDWAKIDRIVHAAILGGRRLYREDDFIVSYLTPAQVRDVAEALAAVAEPAPREVWESYAALKDFFKRAAGAGHHTIFTVDVLTYDG